MRANRKILRRKSEVGGGGGGIPAMASEFEIIEELRGMFPRIGDDAVEIFSNEERGARSEKYKMIVSTDSFVVGEHFGDYFTPYDMGYKALAASISDISACGGVPKYALISIGLREGDMEFVEKLYKGVKDVAKLHKVEIIGGDTTKSGTIFVSVAVIGETKRFIGRNGARVGDAICVTGELGSSSAGLLALRNGIESAIIRKHLHPIPRVKEGEKLANYVNSMIDISDGLIIDLSHIVEESGVGAKICRDKLPINKEAMRIAEKFSLSAQDFAMNGGEDFELLFTIPRDKVKEAKRLVEFTEIGEIIKVKSHPAHKSMCGTKVKIIDEDGMDIPIKGFDHFNRW